MGLKVFKNRYQWLEARGERIGGSEAACLIGLNSWKSNVQLFREKTGRVQPEDLSNNQAVQFGAEAEKHIRALFALNHPDLRVEYKENNMYTNYAFPFAHASLDGWLVRDDGEYGILEIKTATFLNSKQKAEWEKRIPDNYYCQVQWYMMVTGYTFAWLSAFIRRGYTTVADAAAEIRDYYIPRDDAAIGILADAGAAFYEALRDDREPALILPEI